MGISQWIVRIAIIVFCVIWAFYLLQGFFRSPRKLLVRCGFLAVSVLLSWLLTAVLSRLLEPQISSLAETMLQDPTVNEVLQMSPTLFEYVLAIVCALLAPLLFLIFFFLLSSIMLIFGRILNKIMEGIWGEDDNVTLPRRFLAVGIACVSAFIVSTSVFMPFMGYATTADQVYKELTAREIVAENSTIELYLGEVNTAKKSWLLQFETAISAPLFNSVATMHTSSGSRLLTDELNGFLNIATDAIAFSKTDFSNISNIDMTMVDKIVDDVTANKDLSKILAEVLQSLSNKWANDEVFLGQNLKSSLDVDLVPIVDVLITDFKNTSSATVGNDIKQLTSAFTAVIGLYDSLSTLNFNDVSNIDYTVIEDAIAVIDENKKLEDVLAVVLSNACQKWSAGQTYLSIDIANQIPAEFHGALNVVFTELGNTQSQTVCADITSFLNSLQVLNQLSTEITKLDFTDYSTLDLTVFDGVIDLIESDELVTKVCAVLLNEAGTAWGDTPPRAYFGINLKEELPEGFINALDAPIEKFSTCTDANCVQTLRNFLSAIETYKYLISLGDPNATQEEKVQNIIDFISSVNTDNIELIQGIITEEMLIEAGISPENSAIIQEIATSALGSIASLPEEVKNTEAEALNKLLGYANNSGSVTDAELVETIMSSESLSQSIIDYSTYNSGSMQATEAEKLAISNALEQYELSGDAGDLETANAIKKLFDIV